jgi:hypothetical protein
VGARLVAALLALPLLAAACGGSSGPGAGTLGSLAGSGQELGLLPGSADFGPGAVRWSFLFLDQHGRSIDHPSLSVWIARARDGVPPDGAVPFLKTTARIESTAPPGDADQGHMQYVVHARIDRPGKFWVLARPPGEGDVHGLGSFIVQPRSYAPAVGARAPASDTPTLGSAPIKQLTTRIPPDRALLRSSVAGSLRAHAPFVVTFATPAFCSSKTCGPVVDVVDHVRKQFARSDVRFIHVEIYRDNDPVKGMNRWVKQWHLPTEPFTFVVGRDGRIKAKFEGALSVGELARAVRRYAL